MAFTFTVKKQTYFGDLKVVIGIWDGTGVTTGELDLSPYFAGKIYAIIPFELLAAAPANPVTIDETFPLDSGTAATLVFLSGSDGLFMAFGEGA